MSFKEWIKQAYGVDGDDHTARFTVYNMEVAYESGRQSMDALLTLGDINRLRKEVEYQQAVIYHLVNKLKEKE